MQNTGSNKKLLIIGGIFLALVLAAILSFGRGGEKNTAVIHVTYGGVDTSDAILVLDGGNTPADVNYQVKPGQHSVTIQKPGYKDFHASVSLDKTEEVVINARLEREGGVDIQSVADLNIPLAPNIPPQDVSLESLQYFANKSWAVATIDVKNVGGAIVVDAYDGKSKKWFVVAGPGTEFDTAGLQGVPQEVRTYMQDKGYVIPEAQ
jgi:hypothetical protein